MRRAPGFRLLILLQIFGSSVLGMIGREVYTTRAEAVAAGV